MRQDMDKVIVERPRTGGDHGKSDEPKGYKKKLNHAMTHAIRDENADGTWNFESSSRKRKYGWDAKELNEHLSPLRRFLQSKVGEPWKDVYSEICENLRINNAVQSHVRDHVDSDVERNVVMVDGKPMHATKEYGIYSPFYVNPDTGILCKTNRKKFKWKGHPKNYIETVDEFVQYHVIDGIWYAIQLAPFPEGLLVLDVMANARPPHGLASVWTASRTECRNRYGKYVYGVSKRQLNGKDIKKYKLWETEVGINARKGK